VQVDVFEDDVPVCWVDQLLVSDFEVGRLGVEEEMSPLLVGGFNFEDDLVLEVGLV